MITRRARDKSPLRQLLINIFVISSVFFKLSKGNNLLREENPQNRLMSEKFKRQIYGIKQEKKRQRERKSTITAL